MKKLFSLIFGVCFLLTVSAAPSAKLKAATKSTSINTKEVKKKQVDSYAVLFAFSATPTSSGYYHIIIYCYQYDITTNTLYSVTCPVNVSITLTSGPYSGEEIPFPSGSSSLDAGDWYFGPTSPAGNNYSATTNPTTIGGFEVAQELYGGSIL